MEIPMITISIDGKKITTENGMNLLQVALKNGIKIPNLCYHKYLSPSGACRLCIVKIKGMRGFTTACTVNVTDGMEVIAFDDELEKIRKTTLEMLLANHNDDCINCVRDGGCELQDLVFQYNISRSERDLLPIWENLKSSCDNSSQILNYDATKCIQCERCVKACKEIQGKGVLAVAERGANAYIVAGIRDWLTSECDGCGQCIQSCPTAAISLKTQGKARIRNKDIEKTTTTTCPYCGVGCQLQVSTIDNEIVKVEGADEIPNFTRTCVKGKFGLDFVTHKDRLKTPLIKRDGEFVEVSWQEALDYTAQKLAEIKQKYGSDAIMGLASARTTNEDNFVMQKFMRAAIGTNNIDHCARLCHSSTVSGLSASFGSGAMTNSIAELEHADLILITGSNTTETHPVIATYIKRATLLHGAKLVVVEPRKIAMANFANIYLQQKNGTDIAWLNGLMHIICKENWHNKKFITERTEGFADFQKSLERYTPEYVEKITGIAQEKLFQVAKLFSEAKNASIVYAMGITQHKCGTNNVKAIANLAMLTGQIGKENSGVNPLRGQNNVQGACDMGALPGDFPGYQKVTNEDARKKFSTAWNAKLPEKPGFTLTEVMDEAIAGKVKAMYFMGENPMVSDPNIHHIEKALKSLDFLVCQDIFLSETAKLANVVLPAISFAEKNGTFTNTERRVLAVNKIIDPIFDAKPDWWIIQEIAKRIGYNMNYSSSLDILDEINSLTPIYAGITKERIRDGAKLQWPCLDENHQGTKFLHKDKFSKGIGTFYAVEHEDPAEVPDSDFPFTLSTGRVLYHYHTCTMTRKTKVLPQYLNDAYVEINPKDAAKIGIKNNDFVDVSTRRGTIKIKTRITDHIAEKNAFIPFHFVEAAANILTNNALDPTAKIPEYKVCACKIVASK